MTADILINNAPLINMDGDPLSEMVGTGLDLTAGEVAALDELTAEYLTCQRADYTDTADLEWWLRTMLLTEAIRPLRSARRRFDVADIATVAMIRLYGLK